MAHVAIRHDLDMCNGPMLGNIIRFAIPVAMSGFLQQLYNSADMAVAGRFAGKEALAAVGATGALTNLIVNLFMGFSIGAGVAVARARGAQEPENVSRAVHTSMALAGASSLLAMLAGVLFSAVFLAWMGVPADVLPGATLYMQIYFAGMPFNLLFNFGSAILRAVGDTKRPLYYLSLSGLVNVGLNLIFVIVFHMGIAGVALATIISQAISSVLVILALLHTHEDDLRLHPRKLRVHRDVLLEIVSIGLPSGVQNSLLSFANVLIQSAINSFGSAAIAGGTAAQNLQAYVWTLMNGLHQANTTFTSQNRGARKIERVRRAGWICTGLVFATGVVMGALLCWIGPQLLTLYNTDPAVIEMGMRRMRIIAPFSFAYGSYIAFASHLRGMGYSVFPMFASLIGICGFRILWLKTVFVAIPTLETIFWVFPVSLVFTIILILAMDLYVAYRALPRQMAAASTPT